MILLRAIAVAGLVCSIASGCASGDPYEVQTYTVRPHDTLYSIAWRHDLDYRDLAKWNNVGPDLQLSIGQVLILQSTVLSGTLRSPASSPSVSPPSSPLPPTALTPAPATAPMTAHPPAHLPITSATVPSTHSRQPQSVPSASGNNATWVWPTDRLSVPRPVPGGGVLLLGRLGQDVRAASSGRVVYTGSGLRGYGNLIIIKHGDSLLSSYAHNRELLVHEGQDVVTGQVIAHMGTGPHQVCALYFEIRVSGKPTDPLRYLSSAR